MFERFPRMLTNRGTLALYIDRFIADPFVGEGRSYPRRPACVELTFGAAVRSDDAARAKPAARTCGELNPLGRRRACSAASSALGERRLHAAEVSGATTGRSSGVRSDNRTQL